MGVGAGVARTRTHTHFSKNPYASLMRYFHSLKGFTQACVWPD